MRYAIIASIFASLLAAHAASALSVDDKSLNGSDGAPRFSDPDDATPMTLSPPSSVSHFQNAEGSNSGSTDPSSIRYDYDPASGSYTPHRQ